MNKYQKKILAALSTGVMLFSTVAPAMADTTLVISGNGSNTTNNVTYAQTSTRTVVQNNTSNISNNIDVDAETGENDANDNTGGDVSIKTGDADANVTVKNYTGSNHVSFDCCDGGEVEVVIAENGSDSNNTVGVAKTNVDTFFQYNNVDVANDLDVDSKTGENDANDNTGGNVQIETGDADADVDVTTKAGANWLKKGGPAGASSGVSAWIVGNGSDTNNTINLALTKVDTITQNNTVDVGNNLDVDAETGENDANDNTGGSVSIKTGDADANVNVENLVGWNWADIACDCVFGDILVKVAGNGTESDNKIGAALTDVLTLHQDNVTGLDNDLDVDAETGENDANDNGGGVLAGDPSIETGDADVDVNVHNESDSNVYGEPASWTPWGGEQGGSSVDINITIDINALLEALGLDL